MTAPTVQRATGASLLAIRRIRLWPARWALVCLVLGAATLASFAQLAEDDVTNDPLVRWDERFARRLHVRATPAGVDIFGVVTTAGDTVFLTALTASAAITSCRHGISRHGAALLGHLVILGTVCIELLPRASSVQAPTHR